MARPTITVQQTVTEYLDLRSFLSEGTLRSYRETLALLVRSLGPDLQVRSVGVKHMEHFLINGPKARRKTLSGSTYNKERQIIKGWCQFLLRRNYILTDVMGDITAAKVVVREKRRLTADELLDCLEAQTHPRDRMIMALAMHTGLRSSEMRTLKVGHVNLETGYIFTVLHKNHKEDQAPITLGLDRELRRWLTWYTEKQGGLSDSFYLIPAKEKPRVDRRGEEYMNLHQCDLKPHVMIGYHATLYPVKQALRHLGYDTTHEGMHMIRRSAARLMYDYLVNLTGDNAARDNALRIVQRTLNHSSVQTTEKYIGMDREGEMRDKIMHANDFIVSKRTGDNVIPLRPPAVASE